MSADRRLGRVDRLSLAAALVVAVVATAGSLNYSLGIGLFPCRLCWYQRILMYPLVIVLGVMVLSGRADPPPWQFVLPFSVPGVAIAAYHSWLQVTPSATCSFAGCATVQYRLLGLTIPNQSLIAFSLITAIVGGTLVRSLLARDRTEVDEFGRPLDRASPTPDEDGTTGTEGDATSETDGDDVTGTWDDGSGDDETPDRG